eukprot:6764366-Pyramimonas_sp.AAC.2
MEYTTKLPGKVPACPSAAPASCPRQHERQLSVDSGHLCGLYPPSPPCLPRCRRFQLVKGSGLVARLARVERQRAGCVRHPLVDRLRGVRGGGCLVG